ncbi:MAG: recombination mediator RecR [Kiritimatiellia bacterium]
MSLEALDKLTDALSRLPGIGRRSASRMAVKLAADPQRLGALLAAALDQVRREVRFCGRCGALTSVERDPCLYCTDHARDQKVLCVVEDPSDIDVIEETGVYRGRYHVLMGRISPLRGEGPNDIRLRTLVRRVREEGVAEVVLALNTDLEGEATAGFIAVLLQERGVRVTHPAYGLPAGSGVRYADAVTLGRALEGRRDA